MTSGWEKLFRLAVDREALSIFRNVTKPLYDLTPMGHFPDYDKAREKVSEDIRKERGIAPDVWQNTTNSIRTRPGNIERRRFSGSKERQQLSCPISRLTPVSLTFQYE